MHGIKLYQTQQLLVLNNGKILIPMCIVKFRLILENIAAPKFLIRPCDRYNLI